MLDQDNQDLAIGDVNELKANYTKSENLKSMDTELERLNHDENNNANVIIQAGGDAITVDCENKQNINSANASAGINVEASMGVVNQINGGIHVDQGISGSGSGAISIITQPATNISVNTASVNPTVSVNIGIEGGISGGGNGVIINQPNQGQL